jgi:hypothetical protein
MRFYRPFAIVAVLTCGCGQVVVAEPDTGADTAVDQGQLPDTARRTDTAAEDKAPQVKIQTPEKGGIINKGKVIHFRATASDDKDAPSSLKVVWKSSAVKDALLEGTIDAAGVSEFDSDKLPPGSQKVSVEVTDSAGNKGTDEAGVLINTAPGAPVVAIQPDKPTTQDALVAKILTDATDPDRSAAELKYAYAWLKDGAATEFKEATLPAGTHKKGETWKVEVTAIDKGNAPGPPASAQVVIANSAPLPPALAITPTSVDLLSDVTCVLVAPAKDPDGDGIGYTYTWLVNGYANTQAPGTAVNVKNLVADKDNGPVKAGHLLACAAVAQEGGPGGLKSPEVKSAEVTLKPFDVCGSDLNPCDAAAACTNTDTLDVVCTCPKGFTGDGKICFDVDECATGACSLYADCTNTQGSYECGCKVGYIGDGVDCSDVNECDDGTAKCDLAADCTNTSGSFTCTCKTGYSGDGKTCSDIDECATGGAASTVPKCSQYAECKNSVGGYTCTCKPGFEGPGDKCEDVDECKLGKAGCDPNAECKNTVGSAECSCPAGWTGDGKTCTDVDECKAGPGGSSIAGCDPNATCTNKPGSVLCECKKGYQGDGKNCSDVDECKAGTSGCSANAACVNKVGSFMCVCKPGYAGDGKDCSDIDECKEGVYPCAPKDKATCTNLVGSYKCACIPPLQGDGKSCSQKDLCLTNAAGCSADATCKMVDENVVCTCKPGYTGDGKTCTDVNECLKSNGGCSADATCANQPGTFKCDCKAGYTGDGIQCADVNECATNNGGCAKDTGICTNKPGTFTCTCKPGYAGDGKTCSDIDECKVNNGGCSPSAICTNTPGSNTCACKPGYTGDGKTCTDIDECKQAGSCSPDATCTNSAGGFTCACKPGFTGDGKTCKDVDECATNNGGCAKDGGLCTNLPGTFKCECKSGWTGDGKTCTDVDECPQVQWTWNFASQGGPGWTLSPPSVVGTNVKWHIWNGNLYYGDPTKGNFDTGASKNVGEATGPAVTLSNHPAHTLTFDMESITECGSSFDNTMVQIVVGGAPATVWQKSTQMVGCGQPGLKPQTATFNGFGGKTVQIRFRFDSIDQIGNTGKGVSINNLKLIGTGAPCDVNATCQNTVGSFTCTCQGIYMGDGKKCAPVGSNAETAAKTCAEIYAKYAANGKSMPSGNYFLSYTGQPAQAFCDGQGWQRMTYDTFEGGTTGGWSPKAISACGGYGNVLGGFNIAGAGYVMTNVVSALPPHTQVRVNGSYLRVDTWDGEAGWVKIDGTQVWSAPFTHIACASPCVSYCGVAGFQESMTGFNTTANHTAPQVKVEVGSTLDQGPADESFGLDNMYIWVK